MRFVEEHQRVLGQIIDQRRRRVARLGAAQMARIIFDALGEADFLHHFQVETGALFEPLLFDQFIFLAEKFQPLAQLGLDGFDGAQHGLARRHVMRDRDRP